MVTLGTKIIGDFGGYTELWNGEVVVAIVGLIRLHWLALPILS